MRSVAPRVPRRRRALRPPLAAAARRDAQRQERGVGAPAVEDEEDLCLRQGFQVRVVVLIAVDPLLMNEAGFSVGDAVRDEISLTLMGEEQTVERIGLLVREIVREQAVALQVRALS